MVWPFDSSYQTQPTASTSNLSTVPANFTDSFSSDLSLGSLTVPTVDVSLDGINTNTNNDTGSWFDGAFTNKQGGQGWLAPSIQAASGVAQSFLGFQQLSEGRRQNQIAQNQWQAQFDIQKQEYDRRTSERNARVAANNAAKTSVGG